MISPIDRATRRHAFLEKVGWGDATVTPLASDASFRAYHRLRRDGERAMLMDAPPPREDVRPFVRIARHLLALGLSAPAIRAEDPEQGFLLLEDFGDDTFTRLLAQGADEEALYASAIDALAHLHRLDAAIALPASLPAYDEGRLLDEALLLIDWYLPAMLGAPANEAAREGYIAAWRGALSVATREPPTLVLRDFHVDNLMRLAGREGLAGCGLLDFQDALAGPAAYDLMSLLEDARRDIAEELRQAMLARYHAALGTRDPERFARVFAVLAAQRHAKVIGIFTRLCVRDGKPRYLEHIPRVWRLLEGALAREPALTAVSDWLERHLPATTRGIPAWPTPRLR